MKTRQRVLRDGSRWRALVSCVFIYAALSACSNDAELSTVGLLEWDRVELIAEINEPIVETVAREGDMLATGALILRQDQRRVQAQLEEAQAAQTQAEARLAELKRGPREERIDEARAKLQGATSEAANTKRELERIRSLFEKNLISPEAVDAAANKFAQAFAAKNAAHAALEELLRGTTAEELQQAEATVAQAQARVRQLSITLDNLVLRAPRAGRLDSLPYKTGERPATGAVVAVMLVNEVPYARVYVPEPVRVQVHQGSQATVYIDGLDEGFPGKVRKISSEAVFTPYYSLTERDRARLSFVAEIELSGPLQRDLPSGVPVRVDFKAAP